MPHNAACRVDERIILKETVEFSLVGNLDNAILFVYGYRVGEHGYDFLMIFFLQKVWSLNSMERR